MKEQLYTIPVNDAFEANCECPLCAMYQTLEQNSVDFTMGSSYMEDDIRAQTDQVGFCDKHIRLLYENQNRLGLALILKTHMDKTIKDVTNLTKTSKVSSSLFKKKTEQSPLISYLHKLQNSCFVCNQVDNTFHRYLITIYYLYRTEDDFRKKFSASKGFCNKHYAMLYEHASSSLSGNTLQDFISELNQLYLSNMQRVRDDLDWFINKFDYRFVNEPWKNSKDALPRTINKTNSIQNLD